MLALSLWHLRGCGLQVSPLSVQEGRLSGVKQGGPKKKRAQDRGGGCYVPNCCIRVTPLTRSTFVQRAHNNAAHFTKDASTSRAYGASAFDTWLLLFPRLDKARWKCGTNAQQLKQHPSQCLHSLHRAKVAFGRVCQQCVKYRTVINADYSW